MYMYPDNLKGKATLWLWYLRDIGIVGVGAIIGVIAISHANFYMPMALVGCYAFLTIRMADTSIFDFLSYAFAFFILSTSYVKQCFFPTIPSYLHVATNHLYFFSSSIVMLYLLQQKYQISRKNAR